MLDVMTRSGAVLRTSVLMVALVLLLGYLPPPSAAASTLATCVEGFDLVDAPGSLVPSAVLTTAPSAAIVVGSARTGVGRWSARITRFGSGGWHTLATRAPTSDSGLVAIDGDPKKGRWAVGFKRTSMDLLPYALRQMPSGAWREVPVPRAASEAAALTDVAVSRRDAVWAVGYRLDSAGSQRPHVVRWNGRRWLNVAPPIGPGQRGMLATVSSTPSGGTWIAGSIRPSAVDRPYVARREQGKWKRLALPSVGAGSITSIMVHGKQAGWAVGYAVASGAMRPLVLRWNGTRWTRFSPPELPEETVLLDVDLDAGTVVVTGSTWDATAGRMRPMVARRNGTTWRVRTLKGFEGDAVMADIDGSRPHPGYLATRATRIGALVRTCEGDGVGTAARKSARQDRRSELATPAGREVHPAEIQPAPRAGLASAPQLRISPPSAVGVNIVDRTVAAGLPNAGHTYGAVIRDFDGNGQMDIFLGGHGDPAVLYLNDDGVFGPASVEFGLADRHGCTASDVDDSGLPDLYCTFGGDRGLGVKANELWLDPGGPTPRLAADAGGVRELLGRGRLATVFDYDDDGRKDLVVGQAPNRVDGQPSVNRVYRWTGPGKYQLLRDAGLAPSVGAREFDTGDFDRDGRVDLLMVSFDPKAGGRPSTLRLYRNTTKGLRDVRAARGIKTIGERDAELVGLNSDDKLDIVQLSSNRIRVSLQRNGKFVTVFERRLSNAKALAVGDADGDGDMDIFVLRHKKTAAINDLILFNRGDGRRYRAVEAPSRRGGSADQVYAIDHDGNGLTDFLVLNGLASALGPIQLVAFYNA